MEITIVEIIMKNRTIKIILKKSTRHGYFKDGFYKNFKPYISPVLNKIFPQKEAKSETHTPCPKKPMSPPDQSHY